MNITPCGYCNLEHVRGNCWSDELLVKGTYYTPCACGESKVCCCLGICMPYACKWFTSPCVCKHKDWYYSPCGYCQLNTRSMDMCPLELEGKYYTCCGCGESRVCCCLGIICPHNCKWFASPCFCTREKNEKYVMCSPCCYCNEKENTIVSCVYCACHYKGKKYPTEGDTNDPTLNRYIKIKGLQYKQDVWYISNVCCRLIGTEDIRAYPYLGPVRQQMIQDRNDAVDQCLVPIVGPYLTKLVRDFAPN